MRPYRITSYNVCYTKLLRNKKVKLALSHGLEVILCVGELLEEREASYNFV